MATGNAMTAADAADRLTARGLARVDEATLLLLSQLSGSRARALADHLVGTTLSRRVSAGDATRLSTLLAVLRVIPSRPDKGPALAAVAGYRARLERSRTSEADAI